MQEPDTSGGLKVRCRGQWGHSLRLKHSAKVSDEPKEPYFGTAIAHYGIDWLQDVFPA